MQYIRRMSNREHLKLLDWSSPLGKRRLIHCHVERGAWGQPWGSQPAGYVGPGDTTTLRGASHPNSAAVAQIPSPVPPAPKVSQEGRAAKLRFCH